MDIDTNIFIRSADEGIPIAAIKRIFKVSDAEEIREVLRAALQSGRILELPKEDWPAVVSRADRVPTIQQRINNNEDDIDIIMRMAHTLKTTKLEGRVLLVILRRGLTSRAQLHDAVEVNRGRPDDETQEKIVDVVICKLRKKLEKTFNIDGKRIIRTTPCMGYEMSDVDRQKAWKYINEPTE